MKHPYLLTTILLLIFSLNLAAYSATQYTARADTSGSTWQVNISGLVNNPTNFTLTDLKAMPQTTVSASIICVGSPGTVLENGSWTGVKLSTLLNQAGGIQPDAIKVAFYASDGFTTDLTIAQAKSDNVILAYAKDGAPLPEVLRLVVPGHWGYKWITQVTNIELVNYDFTGKYESTGYSDEGLVAQSDVPTIQATSTPPDQTAPSAAPTPTSPPNVPAENVTSQQSSVQQPNQTHQPNVTPQNFNSEAVIVGISIVIIVVVVALIAAVKKKNSSNHHLSAVAT
jgi:DMSO/TMAO reductase YedYZ molybdopterin-dependent catalytic subunit